MLHGRFNPEACFIARLLVIDLVTRLDLTGFLSYLLHLASTSENLIGPGMRSSLIRNMFLGWLLVSCRDFLISCLLVLICIYNR